MSQGDTVSQADVILSDVSERLKEILDIEDWLWWTDLVRIAPPFVLLAPAILVSNTLNAVNLIIVFTVFVCLAGSILIWRVKLRRRKAQLLLEVGALQAKFAKAMYSAKGM